MYLTQLIFLLIIIEADVVKVSSQLRLRTLPSIPTIQMAILTLHARVAVIISRVVFWVIAPDIEIGVVPDPTAVNFLVLGPLKIIFFLIDRI